MPLPQADKVTNEGATAQGRFSSSEFNDLINYVASLPQDTSLPVLQIIQEKPTSSPYKPTYHNAHMFIRCPKGFLTGAETLVFMRWMSSRMFNKNIGKHYRTKGWIRPGSLSNVYLSMTRVSDSDVSSILHFKNSTDYDWWRVLPSFQFRNVVGRTYYSSFMDYEQDAAIEPYMPSMRKRCAIMIYSGSHLISRPLCFRVNRDPYGIFGLGLWN